MPTGTDICPVVVLTAGNKVCPDGKAAPFNKTGSVVTFNSVIDGLVTPFKESLVKMFPTLAFPVPVTTTGVGSATADIGAGATTTVTSVVLQLVGLARSQIV